MRGDVAAIILEPVAGNMGCIPPKPDFLEGLRKLCDDHDVVLIFDEVMTGFPAFKGRSSGTVQCMGGSRHVWKNYWRRPAGWVPMAASRRSWMWLRLTVLFIKPVRYRAIPLAMSAGKALLRVLEKTS